MKNYQENTTLMIYKLRYQKKEEMLMGKVQMKKLLKKKKMTSNQLGI